MTADRDTTLEVSLALVRYTVAAFFAVWVVEKFVKPETTQAIFKAFYYVEALPLEASYAVGVIQAVVLIAFVLGLFKTWSYGALTLMHAGSTLASWQQLSDPYTGVNHLFWASVPVLGAMIALWILRRRDRFATLGS